MTGRDESGASDRPRSRRERNQGQKPRNRSLGQGTILVKGDDIRAVVISGDGEEWIKVCCPVFGERRYIELGLDEAQELLQVLTVCVARLRDGDLERLFVS